MFTLSVIIARGQDATVERLQASAPTIKKRAAPYWSASAPGPSSSAFFADRFAGLFPV